MGVTEKFEQLTVNLRTGDDALISARCRSITKRINFDFWDSSSETNHTRYLGSYGRGTDIKGHSDVDLAAELPSAIYSKYNTYSGNGQSALLQAIRNSIKVTYPSTEVGGDGQVVVVQFADGIKFEVLPVFINTNKSYTYPDSNNGGTWKTTNPLPEIQSINTANIIYKKKVKRLSRITRAWKKKNNVPIKGLLIDTFAYNFMSQWEYNDKSYLYYDYMTRDFMKYLSERSESQQYWSAPGSGERVWRIGTFETKAGQAYQTALDAIVNEAKGYTYTATSNWKEIFGSYFSG